MKITVFTGNQRRHVAYVNRLSEIAERVFAVVEASTVFPGIAKGHYHTSEVMESYFREVRSAEEEVFPSSRFLNSNVEVFAITSGDLNQLEEDDLTGALDSDFYLIFGSSYIKGWLVDFLVEKKAINIHMGLSPYYRGNSCNFWALYDERPEMIGATVHLLSRGLDSGPILFHSRPTFFEQNAFEFTMSAVDKVQIELIAALASGTLGSLDGVAQDMNKEIRYSRKSDFNDAVAAKFLANPPNRKDIGSLLRRNDSPDLILLNR